MPTRFKPRLPKKSAPDRRRSGFTLLEALASAALLATGITAALGALGAMARSEAGVRERAFVQRLALDKYDEMISTNQQAVASQSGDFSDRNLQGYNWTLDVETSQVSNLSTVTMTVQKAGAGPKDPSGVVEGLFYVSPNSTSAASAPNSTSTPP